MAKQSSSNEDSDLPPRGEDLSAKAKYKKDVDKLLQQVLDGWTDKANRIQSTERYWKVYNCELTANQAYSGNSQIFLPYVRDAVEARVQRFINTLFPETGRYVDLVTHPRDFPHATIGLMDHYVRRADLREKARELLRNGEVEGQFSLYVDWIDTKRYITKKVEKHPEVTKGVYDPTQTFMDVEEDVVSSGRPRVRIIHDSDLVVLPVTMDSIEEDADAIVCLRHTFTKEGLKQAAKDGLFDREKIEKCISQMENYDPTNQRTIQRQIVGAVGIGGKADKKNYIVLEVWKRFKVDRKLRWCRLFFGGENLCLGMTVNPNWNDRCPIISKARQKIDGSFFGKSPIDAVEQLQYMANDFINMAHDSAEYSVLPIILTDPEKNPQYASMILNNAAVWPTSPNDTKILEMPQLWKDALAFVQSARSEILQAFGLNPAMVTMGSGSGRKPTQAMVAQEQMVALANITDEVLTLEDAIFTPLLQMFFELDQQFRDDEITIKVFGQEGIAAKMEAVPPFAWDDRYEFMWRGSQIVKSQQANQQMIAGLNVLQNAAPLLQQQGKKVDLVPIFETIVENIYGPRLGARIIIDQRDQLSVDPNLENEIMAGGMCAEVHPGDDDPKHLQTHQAAAAASGDPTGQIRIHMQKHQMQMTQKAQAAQGGAPGQQAGSGPRPGAQPAQPRGGQGPAGMIHNDQMRDPATMPRRAVG